MPRGSIWITRRARNALRARTLLTIVGIGVFLAVFITVAVTRRAPPAAAAAAAAPAQRPDTLDIQATLERVIAQSDSAESVLAPIRDSLRAVDALPAPPPTDPLLIARRDSILAVLTPLERRIQRTESAPLAESYRALAETPSLREISEVRTLLDSLTVIEREREDYGALGGVDPVYVALTARITTLGRSIRAVADRRRDSMRAALQVVEAALPPAPAARRRIVQADTNPIARMRDSMAALADSLERALASTRERLRSLDEADAAAGGRTAMVVPPAPLAGGSAALGLFVALAVALSVELRTPRLSDPHEVEEIAAARVIGRIHGGSEPIRPGAFNPGDEAWDGFRRIYLFLTGGGTNVAVASFVPADDRLLASLMAIGVATVAAREGRGTLLVDGDLREGSIAELLGVRSTPGVSDILRGESNWPETIAPHVLGRDTALDVIPAGTGDVRYEQSGVRRVREGLARMARRYDIVVANVPLETVSFREGAMVPTADVILCAQLYRTRVSEMTKAVAALRSAGMRLVGVILWEGEAPEVVTLSYAHG